MSADKLFARAFADRDVRRKSEVAQREQAVLLEAERQEFFAETRFQGERYETGDVAAIRVARRPRPKRQRRRDGDPLVRGGALFTATTMTADFAITTTLVAAAFFAFDNWGLIAGSYDLLKTGLTVATGRLLLKGTVHIIPPLRKAVGRAWDSTLDWADGQKGFGKLALIPLLAVEFFFNGPTGTLGHLWGRRKKEKTETE